MGARPRFVLVTAAGLGTRLGAGPKALVTLGGVTLLARALAAVRDLTSLAGVAVTAPAGLTDRFDDICLAADLGVPHRVTTGGNTRQESVRRGLDALAHLDPLATSSRATVLIHDAARCYAPTDLFARVAAAVEAGYDCVTPSLPVTDTVTCAAGPATSLTVDGHTVTIEPAGTTLNRDLLRAVQTPQGFTGAAIWRAHALAADAQATDDAQLVAAAGGRCVLIEGALEAFKITVPADLARARALGLEHGTSEP